MVSSASRSYADRAKLTNRSHPSSHTTSPDSTDVEPVEKHDDISKGRVVNGQGNVAPTSTPNFWAARKEQMARAAPSVTAAASSSSSPTLASSPLLPAAPLPASRGPNGVDLTDSSSWPQVTTASTPVKDKSSSAKDPTTPTPTPKKGEKTKWVPIPPTELQAAADAATRNRSSPKHSAATSTHSSPKTSSRGRRLPADDTAPDSRARSPSRLAKHAYTHPLNSPTRPSVSFVHPLPPTAPHHPPLTLQRRPLSPARSGPVAGYRDIDDLTRAAGRLVMFGTIGGPAGTHASPPQRSQGLGLDTGAAHPREEPRDPHPSRGFAIGLAPDELARTRARRRRSAPSLLGSPDIVDLTDGAWDRKWEFGTSRLPPEPPQQQQQQQPVPPPPPMMYPPPPLPHMAMYPPPPLPMPEHMGDPAAIPEYDPRAYGYGEPYGGERRGGYPGRRGRYAGGRGGPNGRGFGRRGGGGPSQHYYAPPPPMPPPPPPPPPPPGADGYYMGPQYSVPYIPPPAPVPMPVTVTSFPIDPTRWYLLGQLEYYFSVQNLVSDYWLRQQMDNRGWVPVAVIASFNRVRHLTYDTALVRDVLQLSALVEVRAERVRLRGGRWRPFVLPDAPPSELEEEEPAPLEGAYVGEPYGGVGYGVAAGPEGYAGYSAGPDPFVGPEPYVGGSEGPGEERPHEAQEEDDEDVVFVMGREAEERRAR